MADKQVRITVSVQPGSAKDQLVGYRDNVLKIKVKAPPEKGKANQCLIEFLAKQLGVKKNAISIISGQTSTVKSVQVLGVSAEVALKKLVRLNND